MGVHRIRLAAPWELRHPTAVSAETHPKVTNCRLPLEFSELFSQGPESDSEAICISRKFHCPTGIDRSTRVFIEIVLENIVTPESLQTVELNEETLLVTTGSDPTVSLLQVDVSGRLTAFNVLRLQFPAAASHTSGRLLSVTLVIEE